jgi:hypothetical protein
MLQGILWLFDDPISDLLLVGILVSVVLHFREMKLLQKRTNQLALQVSERHERINRRAKVGHLSNCEGREARASDRRCDRYPH